MSRRGTTPTTVLTTPVVGRVAGFMALPHLPP
jgi:hypothetical protein